VLDFGFSKLVDPTTGSPIVTRGGAQLTRPDSLIGSPNYMSPEQLTDPRAVNIRTDIWSLGVILFEMLTGQRPFEGKTLPELCSLILNEKPRSIRELRPDLAQGLEAIVDRCLKRLPTQRYADVGALMKDLAPFAPPVSVAGVPLSAPSPQPAARPAWRRWIVAAVGLLLALALAATVSHQRRTSPVVPALAATVTKDAGTAAATTAPAVAAPN
jgi:serine/threonine-protein kinase